MLNYPLALELNAFFGSTFSRSAPSSMRAEYLDLLQKETHFAFISPNETSLQEWREMLKSEFTARKSAILTNLQSHKQSLETRLIQKDFEALADLALLYGNFPLALENLTKALSYKLADSAETDLGIEQKLLRTFYLVGDWSGIRNEPWNQINQSQPATVAAYLAIATFQSCPLKSIEIFNRLFKVMPIGMEFEVSLVELGLCAVLCTLLSCSIGALKGWWKDSLGFQQIILCSRDSRLENAVKSLVSGLYSQALGELEGLIRDFFVFGPDLHRKLFGHSVDSLIIQLKGAILKGHLEMYREIPLSECAKALGQVELGVNQLIEFISKWNLPFKIDQQRSMLVKCTESGIIKPDLTPLDRIIIEQMFNQS